MKNFPPTASCLTKSFLRHLRLFGLLALIGMYFPAFSDPYVTPAPSSIAGLTSPSSILDSGFVIDECGFPLAQYAFDKGYGTQAIDYSFGSNTATMMNGPTWVAGMIGNALEFDGTDDYVQVPHTADLDMVGTKDAFTLMAWIRPRAFQDNDGIITLGVSQSPFSLQLIDGDNDPADGFASIAINGGMTVSVAYTSTLEMDIDQWHHVCVSYDGQQLSFIINGVLDPYSPSATLDIGIVNQAMRLGRGYQGSQTHYEGAIDEVRLYCKAIPISTVQSLYQSGKESCQVQVLINGDFETGTYALNASHTASYSNGSTLGGSWQVFGSSDVTLHRYDHIPNGQSTLIGQGIHDETGSLYHVDLGSYTGNGTRQGIRQTMTGLMPGQTYRLSFRYAKHTSNSLDTAAIRIKIGGGNTLNTTLKAINPGDGHWLQATYFFSPTTSTEELEFKAIKMSGAPACCGFLLDACHLCEIDKAPFPVEWLSFTAKQVAEHVALEWVTASEENNHYFEIERSMDGVHFERISWMGAVGQSTQTQTYSHMDPKPIIGLNHYRIKQVDLDGVFSYSAVNSLHVEPEQVLLRIYPNPITHRTDLTVNLTIPRAQTLQIHLYSPTGHEVWTESLQVQEGYATYQLPLTHVAHGVYLLRVKGPKTSITHKVIIQ